MAVQVIYKTCNCPNCRESLRFTRKDCDVRQVRTTTEHSHIKTRGEDTYLENFYLSNLIERWYLVCPTCKKRVIGFEETLESHRV